ncbi:hypothetical protein BDW71DRAFT_188045 [Aspergillus fruticulosus]
MQRPATYSLFSDGEALPGYAQNSSCHKTAAGAGISVPLGVIDQASVEWMGAKGDDHMDSLRRLRSRLLFTITGETTHFRAGPDTVRRGA